MVGQGSLNHWRGSQAWDWEISSQRSRVRHMPTHRNGEDSSKFVNESRIFTLLPSDRSRAASPRKKARQGCSQVATATVWPSDGAIRASPTNGERERRVKPSTFPLDCPSVGAFKASPTACLRHGLPRLDVSSRLTEWVHRLSPSTGTTEASPKQFFPGCTRFVICLKGASEWIPLVNSRVLIQSSHLLGRWASRTKCKERGERLVEFGF
jgi:hypothetical protein